MSNTYDSAKEAKKVIIDSMINAGYRGSNKGILEMCAYKHVKKGNGYIIIRK